MVEWREATSRGMLVSWKPGKARNTFSHGASRKDRAC